MRGEKNMSFNRVIRFQDDSAQNPKKQVNIRTKNSNSSNNETLVVEQENQLEDEYEIENTENEETVLERINSATARLKSCIEVITSGRNDNNMIGVFGMNSDVAINNVLSLEEMKDNLLFLGKIEITSDVYVDIGESLLAYARNKRGYEVSEVLHYEIVFIMEGIYASSDDENAMHYAGINAPLKIFAKPVRHKYLLNIIDAVRRRQNYRSYSNSRIVIALEMQKFEYETLNMLAKLNSSDLVIIVFSMLNFDMARMSLRDSSNVDCMSKFFDSMNCVNAN